MWRRRQPTKRHRRAGRQGLEERLLRAERRLARGNRAAATLDAVTRELLDIAAEEPGDLSRLNRIGDGLVRADRVQPGIALFERVGRAYAEDGFWAKAIAIYKKILRLDPRRSDVRTKLAFLYQQSGLPTGAGARP